MRLLPFEFPKGRIVEIDVIRGLMAILVVMGHAMRFSWPDTCEDMLLMKIIYSFHMPIFLFVSSWFTGKRGKKTEWGWLRNRIARLCVPYILWSSVCFLLERNMSALYYLRRLCLEPYYWFLVVLMTGDIIYYISCKLCKTTMVYGLMMLQYALGIVLFIILPCESTKRFALYFPWYFLGIIVAQNYDRISYNIKKVVFIICTASYPVLMLSYTLGVTSAKNKVDSIKTIIGIDFPLKVGVGLQIAYSRYIVGFCGVVCCITVVFLAVKLLRKFTWGGIAYNC